MLTFSSGPVNLTCNAYRAVDLTIHFRVFLAQGVTMRKMRSLPNGSHSLRGNIFA
jgi:hypothetical protein